MWKYHTYIGKLGVENVLHCHLREIINDKGLKQTKLAEKMRVSKQTMSAWSTGRITPPLESAFKLARMLECTVEELWEYVEDDSK